MAKGLAVIKGRSTVVFKALEDGNIHLGSTAYSAAVEIHGSLKLATGQQQDGYFLKTDASGQADWAQIAMSDISSLADEFSNVRGEQVAGDAAISQALAEEISTRTGDVDGLDARLTTAEGEINTLQSDLDSLESQFSLLTGDFDASNVLSNLQVIQEYLDGDGQGTAGVITDIGDLTSYTRNLSTLIGDLSASSGGNADAISQDLSDEISRAQSAEADLSQDLSDEVARAVAAEADLSQDLSDEVARAVAAEADLSQDLSDEVARATAREDGLSAAIADAISNSVIDVTGTTAEVEVSVTESPGGRTVVVGLPDDVSIAQSLDVGGDVTLGNSPTDDSVIVNGNFRVPHMTRAQALTVYGNGSALNDQATTISNGHDGHMFYLNDDNAANDTDPLPEGKKWYFCENGIWHASFFYYA